MKPGARSSSRSSGRTPTRAPPAVPGPAIMDALIEAAKRRARLRDLAIFLLLRFTGMRRGSVASLRGSTAMHSLSHWRPL